MNAEDEKTKQSILWNQKTEGIVPIHWSEDRKEEK